MKSEYKMSQLETHVHSPTGEVLQSLSILILVLYDNDLDLWKYIDR